MTPWWGGGMVLLRSAFYNPTKPKRCALLTPPSLQRNYLDVRRKASRKYGFSR